MKSPSSRSIFVPTAAATARLLAPPPTLRAHLTAMPPKLAAFAQSHHLTPVLHSHQWPWGVEFYASFSDVAIILPAEDVLTAAREQEPRRVSFPTGIGKTEEAAWKDYARKVGGRDAYVGYVAGEQSDARRNKAVVIPRFGT